MYPGNHVATHPDRTAILMGEVRDESLRATA
jgi:hypothetical protein